MSDKPHYELYEWGALTSVPLEEIVAEGVRTHHARYLRARTDSSLRREYATESDCHEPEIARLTRPSRRPS